MFISIFLINLRTITELRHCTCSRTQDYENVICVHVPKIKILCLTFPQRREKCQYVGQYVSNFFLFSFCMSPSSGFLFYKVKFVTSSNLKNDIIIQRSISMDKRKACTYAYNVHLFLKMD